MLKIYYSSQCVMKEDEVDSMSVPKKKKKHENGERSSESEECALMTNSVELEEIEPVSGTKHKKKKRKDRCREKEGEATGSEKDKNPNPHIWLQA